jgi:hypothetical protein
MEQLLAEVSARAGFKQTGWKKRPDLQAFGVRG